MQPPSSVEETKVSDSITSDGIKKRRNVQKKADKSTDAAKVDLVSIATSSNQLSETRRPGPYRGKCMYQSRKCENERAIKRNGKPHNLCEEHRSKQNQHQRKFDAKKFSRKRRRDSLSDEDATQSRPREESSIKHRKTSEEAETRTPSRAPTSSGLSGISGNFYSTANATAVTTPLMKLPSIQSPVGLYLSSKFRAEEVPMAQRRVQTPRVGHRPFIQQHPTGYSHSELVAASVLVQPQHSPPHVPVSNRESPISDDNRTPFMITPRVLPSLMASPSSALSPSPNYRLGGVGLSSLHRLASVVMTPDSSLSVSPATSSGNMLPPLKAFGRLKSPLSSSASKSLQK
ncbi:hypothetical protein GN958_ATG20327 [Phytophthora infestans]|uniref:Uncharacterized protein n=1 Tax=Phytophthora infestans TaxID=4787 RepID=A0A8S9TR26_PHYIN|nr:hypothetical protein GN958_ATG20327 [Phytophthora infestans]